MVQMGHVRLGKLPASKQWKDIVQYLATGDVSVAELAERVSKACDASFAKATQDPAFQKAIHLLCQIPQIAKQEKLSESLAQIGIYVPDNPSRTDIIVGFERALEKEQRSANQNITDLSEMAKHSGIAVLNAIMQKPPPPSQGNLLEEVKEKSGIHRLLESSATPEGFGDLAQNFFADLAKNNIRYFMDRELPHHLGPNGFLKSIPDMTLFDKSVDMHCKEASFIMRTFARDWNAKIHYAENRSVARKDIDRFTRVAVEKLRKEFKYRNGENEGS